MTLSDGKGSALTPAKSVRYLPECCQLRGVLWVSIGNSRQQAAAEQMWERKVSNELYKVPAYVCSY